MFCYHCGQPLSADSATCPACAARQGPDKAANTLIPNAAALGKTSLVLVLIGAGLFVLVFFRPLRPWIVTIVGLLMTLSFLFGMRSVTLPGTEKPTDGILGIIIPSIYVFIVGIIETAMSF